MEYILASGVSSSILRAHVDIFDRLLSKISGLVFILNHAIKRGKARYNVDACQGGIKTGYYVESRPKEYFPAVSSDKEIPKVRWLELYDELIYAKEYRYITKVGVAALPNTKDITRSKVGGFNNQLK